VVAALLVPLAVLALVITSRDDQPQGAAVTQDLIQAQGAKLRRESGERDKRQVQELTERMMTMLVELGPVVRGLAETVPPGQKRVGPLATSVAVENWRPVAREAAAYFENPPSGETDTNIARMGSPPLSISWWRPFTPTGSRSPTPATVAPCSRGCAPSATSP